MYKSLNNDSVICKTCCHQLLDNNFTKNNHFTQSINNISINNLKINSISYFILLNLNLIIRI